jgi:Mrp family chromosome partitioning ATPase
VDGVDAVEQLEHGLPRWLVELVDLAEQRLEALQELVQAAHAPDLTLRGRAVLGRLDCPAVKLAIAGKGGSGKTTVAGTMARLAAARGVEVLAIDADLNPNLAFVLGMRPEALDRVTPLPDDLLRHRSVDGRDVLELVRPAEELVSSYGVDCLDRVRLLLMGRPHQAGVG